jgi:hypothetical protein
VIRAEGKSAVAQFIISRTEIIEDSTDGIEPQYGVLEASVVSSDPRVDVERKLFCYNAIYQESSALELDSKLVFSYYGTVGMPFNKPGLLSHRQNSWQSTTLTGLGILSSTTTMVKITHLKPRISRHVINN